MIIDGAVYVPTEGGHMVNEKHAQIAQIIRDYDADLELAWIPPDKRDPGDKPFVVIHRPLGRPAYHAFYAEEDEVDERLLAKIFMGDISKHNPLSRIEAQNTAVKAMSLFKEMEAREEAEDKATHILKSPKNSYTIDDLVIHSDKPHEKRPQPQQFRTS